MKLLVISDAAQWDSFVANQPGSQFLQSWAWGEFKRSQGHEILRLAYADEKGNWVIAGQFMYHPKTLFGGFWFSPRGPIIVHDQMDASEQLFQQFIVEVKKQFINKKAMFIRCEPPIENKIDTTPLPAGFIRRRAIDPSSTVIIGLEQSEEELLSDMKEKTRYNIRLAERKGVTVRTGKSDEDIESYLKLNQETASRDSFISQPSEYIRATVRALRDCGMCQIRLAEYQNQILAANIEMQFGDTLTYLYGASSSMHRNVMAPYALQWSAMKEAKQKGCRFYDLYGSNPVSNQSIDFKSSWEGITRFKLGWGGSRVEYIGTWELPLMPFVYKMMKLIRK
jgi:peptidoglycan pentaglycine glycine transferase (the first glycine)